MNKKDLSSAVVLVAIGFLAAGVAGAQSANVAQSTVTVKAECKSIRRNEACILGWRSTELGESRIRVQQWVRSATEWRDMNDRDIYASRGHRAEPVPPGHLYRVLNCSTSSSTCTSSNSVWAPVWASIEEIPDVVEFEVFGQPHTFSVSKVDTHGELHLWRNVVTQYNMYLVLQESADFFDSDAEMPGMLVPIMKGEAPDTVEEMIAYNVQQEYEQTRLEVLARREGR